MENAKEVVFRVVIAALCAVGLLDIYNRLNLSRGIRPWLVSVVVDDGIDYPAARQPDIKRR